MPDAADRLLAAQQGGYIEYSWAVFAADEHNAEGQQQIARFDRFGSSEFLEVGFEGGRFPDGLFFKVGEEIEEKGLFGL
jgi:hypothetical protein